MGGFFGVVKHDDCVNDLFYGTDYNSHLGTKRAGIATLHNGQFSRQIHSIDNSYFRTKFEADLDEFEGNMGIGVISDTDAQPIIINSRLGKFALVTVAKINNIRELEKELLDAGRHFCEHSYDTLNPTELIGALISEGKDYVEGIKNVYNKVKGSCSMLLLTKEGIIAARDKLGRTPVIIGEQEGAHAISTEDCAFPNLGYKSCYNVGPAEIVLVTPDEIKQLKAPGEDMQICAFMWVYYGYPPCSYEGKNVDEIRYKIGLHTAEGKDSEEIDFVSPVPDSGTGMALGYAAAINKPYLRGMVKYTPTWPRSFTPGSQKRRELVAKMKLIANNSLLKNKRVAFCDDSIVRGTQLRDNVQDIRDAGAEKVHIRISCPPLVYPCKFLNFTASKSEMELIARRVIARLEEEGFKAPLEEFTKAGSEAYNRMVEEIRKDLGLDSLRFCTLETLIDAIGLPKCKVCTHCFDGSSYE
ncbi:MAG: amidophosphoribosyltransferase [Muribaculaceae bacterium]|nr:amidophosphoribosyltransferase [Muribaculaceae bacterium]MDE6702178.1 amidophosphoribosyltransferase [Muribaculaceae bacterium]